MKLEEGYDSVGTLFRADPAPHYSGGYWWSTSKNISTLNMEFLGPNSPHGRFGAEFWIGSNSNTKMFCLNPYDGVDAYNNEFLISKYI